MPGLLGNEIRRSWGKLEKRRNAEVMTTLLDTAIPFF